MIRLNDAPILEQTEDHMQKVLVMALWKLTGGTPVVLTTKDIEDCAQAHTGMPVLCMQGQSDSITLSVVSLARAKEIAEYHQSQAPKGAH